MTPTTPFWEGSPDAKILIVGEAPSFDEIRESRPFVGPSGRLLDLCLHSAKISRAECAITNVFEELVKKGDEKKSEIFSRSGELLWTTKGFTDAGRIAAKPCLERIAKSNANVIVALGGPALHLTLDIRPLLKWRGSIVVNSLGRKIIPSIHPAFILRGEYHNRYLLINDLTKAKAESADARFIPTARNYLIDPSYSEVLAFLRRCLDAPAVNTDIEVLAGQVDCFSLATSAHDVISIPIVDAGFEHRWSLEEEREIWRLYAQILQAPHIAKINQNITFDLAALLELNNITARGPLHDPMVAFNVAYPFLEKKLAVISSFCTREPYYKDDGQLADAPKVEDFQKRWLYNAKDSAVSFESWEYLMPDVDSGGYRATYDMTIDKIPALVYMMVKGLRVDRENLATARTKAKANLAEIVAKLESETGRKIITAAPKKAAEKRALAGALNVNSPAQLKEYLYRDLKLKPYVNSAGAESVDDVALSRIVRRDGLRTAKLLQDYRRVAKLIGTYLDMQFDADDRMRCSFNVRGTWTGRLSSSQTIHGVGGNLQNIPDDMALFLVSDYQPEAQNEAVV